MVGKEETPVADKADEANREGLNEKYQDVAKQLDATWEKHMQDVELGASDEVLEENRHKMNELNSQRYEIIKAARQGSQEDLPDWAQ
jgi:hypothetical protein